MTFHGLGFTPISGLFDLLWNQQHCNSANVLYPTTDAVPRSQASLLEYPHRSVHQDGRYMLATTELALSFSVELPGVRRVGRHPRDPSPGPTTESPHKAGSSSA
jgi:hypothetical protein